MAENVRESMKRIISVLLVSAMLAMTLAGCGSSAKKNSDGIYINDKYNSSEMVTISGEKKTMTDADTVVGMLDYGCSVIEPASWLDISGDNLQVQSYGSACAIQYIPQEVYDAYEKLGEDYTDDEKDEFMEYYQSQKVFIGMLYVVDANDSETEVPADYLLDNTETIATNGDYTYGLTYISSVPDTISETAAKDVQTVLDGMNDFKNGIMLYPKTDTSAGFKGKLDSFTTTDTVGNTVDQSIFANYDVTMVNLWETTCVYCVSEMPDLETLYEGLPENVNMITICYDGADEADDLNSVLESCGATFTTLVSCDELDENLFGYVEGFPTTVFVNSKGKLVGEVKCGAFADPATGYQDLIDKALAAVGK